MLDGPDFVHVAQTAMEYSIRYKSKTTKRFI